MVSERRKERRIRVSLPIKISVQDEFEVTGTTENVSRLGTYLELDREIPIGTDVSVIMEIPAYTQDLSLSGKVHCRGNIFRCNLLRQVIQDRYFGVGIFFTDFPQQPEWNKLSSYIDFLIRNEDKAIKSGLKLRKYKRETIKLAKQKQKTQLVQEEFQREALDLLREIKDRLKEIRHLLKS